jgi:hypothetical protein
VYISFWAGARGWAPRLQRGHDDRPTWSDADVRRRRRYGGNVLGRQRRGVPIIAGIAAVLVVVSLTAGLLSTRGEPAGLEALALASADLPGSINAELVNPTAGGAVADVIVTTEGEGFIEGSALPTLAENRTYQLWAIVGERVISVGIMGNRPETTAFRVEGQLAGLAISEEILGGVVVSEQDPVGVWLDEA